MARTLAAVAVAASVTLSVAVAGCSPAPAAAPTGPVDIFFPEEQAAAPVVVLVPGGGWTSADPSGMTALARWLSTEGVVAATITYRTASDDAYFPTPASDVLCAAAGTVAQAEERGYGGGPLILAGHSAGGHLVVLSALRSDALRGDCPAPAVTPDAVIGLAGAYDVDLMPDVAVDLFGTPRREDPQLWAEGNPMEWVGERPELPVLLLHGDQDVLVRPAMTARLAQALEDAGHPVTAHTVAGADHGGVFSPDVAPLLLDWIRERAAPG